MAGNLAVDVILGDEIRAAETVKNAITGKPVSAASIADAVVTIGADALMFVPGLGAVAAAAKAGRVAKTAAKGAKAASRASRIKQEAKAWKVTGKRASSAMGNTPREKKIISNMESVVDKETRRASKYASNATRAGYPIKGNPTAGKFKTVQKAALDKRAAAKLKRNSPRRKKMRYTGNVASASKDILDFGRAYDKGDFDE